MTLKPIHNKFLAFLAAQYGVSDPAELPERQRLEIEDAYFAGASSGFYMGFAATDAEARIIHDEFQVFGNEIVARYERAGLPLGERRS